MWTFSCGHEDISMIEGLIYFVVYLIIIGLILWVLLYAVQNIPMPAPFAQVAKVVIMVIGALIVILLLLQMLGGLGPVPRLFPRG
jgi:hypothetical protein